MGKGIELSVSQADQFPEVAQAPRPVLAAHPAGKTPVRQDDRPAFLAGFIVSARISFHEDQDESRRREFCCRSHKIFLWPLVAGPLNKPGILYIGANRVGKVTVVLSLGKHLSQFALVNDKRQHN